MPYYKNPWTDAIPVPIEELAECVANLDTQYLDYNTKQMITWTKEKVLENWYAYGSELDTYILPSSHGYGHSIGVRYGNLGNQYLSPMGNQDKIKKLLDKYAIYV